MKVHGAPIQILDLREPSFQMVAYYNGLLTQKTLAGIVEGAVDGRGRGRQVIAGK